MKTRLSFKNNSFSWMLIIVSCLLANCKAVQPKTSSPSTGSALKPFIEHVRVFPFAKGNKPNYRIPSIVKAANGDILIFAEKRRKSIADVGYTDIVMTRSTDKGTTWQKEVLLYGGNNESHADPTTLVDHQAGKIYLFFLRDKKQFYMMSTTDNGVSWTPPKSIHQQVVKPAWDGLKGSVNIVNSPPDSVSKAEDWKRNWVQSYGIGPGNAGIRLSKGPKAGRLLVPARHRETNARGTIVTTTHIFYSDDAGKSWAIGTNCIPERGGEAQLIELANGDVMVNCRNGDTSDSTNIKRKINISKDGGQTWGKDYLDPNLEETSCEASIERYSLAESTGKNRLLFSNPKNSIRTSKHPYGRVNMSVRLSYDEGASWPVSKTIYPYTSSYSGLVILSDNTIGLVYERGKDPATVHYWDELWFARFNLEWLTDGVDHTPKRK
jgi:sialidase-1